MNATERPVIAVDQVTVQYPAIRALDNISATIYPGESVAILGPNGAGKTTLLEVIQGLRRPSAGEVRVLDRLARDRGEIQASEIGIVLQQWRDHMLWTPRQLIDLVSFAHQNVGRGSAEHTQRLIKLLQVTDFLDQRIIRLSGGQRRRMDVCLALMGEPEILILDEPTVAFDPVARREFHEFVQSLRATTTIVWATHDLAEAEKNCERIILLKQGVCIADSPTRELKSLLNAGTLVEWTDDVGARHSERTDNPNVLLADIAVRPGVTDIKVTEANLEDVYLQLLAEEVQS